MRKILLATDFSENARHAVDYALQLFHDESPQFILLNTVDVLQNIPEMLISIQDILQERSLRELEYNVQHLKRHYQTLLMECLSAYGKPTSIIEELVDEKDIDMVVLGCKGASALEEVHLGSNTRHLINVLGKPLLVVPPEYQLKQPKKIVFGTDLKQIEQLDNLDPMIYLARKYNSEIVIFNVTGNEDDRQVQETLHQLDFNKHFSEIRYRFEVVHHPQVLEGILSFLEKEQADMLVLLPKHHHNFKKLFQNGLTRKMVYRTTVPMLMV